ncbi:hypothetical protein PENTCL1PPCAC_8084, partial [Pristionchus entomophagus]
LAQHPPHRSHRGILQVVPRPPLQQCLSQFASEHERILQCQQGVRAGTFMRKGDVENLFLHRMTHPIREHNYSIE